VTQQLLPTTPASGIPQLIWFGRTPLESGIDDALQFSKKDHLVELPVS
jgi:hypothetical protein